jgi:glucosamine 6-phosphate synthetase-like amidotransferase/phosphosugar isomerase protein
MCGVIGWVAKGDAGPDLGVLRDLLLTTQRRGRHAFGMAWVDGRGRLKMLKVPGPAGDHLGLLRLVRDARMLIGHCRYATQGSPAEAANNHPHPADGGWFVHNGKVLNYGDLILRPGVFPSSDCDSEVIGGLIEERAGPILDRCRRAVNLLEASPLVLLGLWNRPDRLVVVRRGHPLHAGGAKGGSYLASLPEGLPGQVVAFPDNHAFTITARGTVAKGTVRPNPAQVAPCASSGTLFPGQEPGRRRGARLARLYLDGAGGE